jgi:hypothetical protein
MLANFANKCHKWKENASREALLSSLMPEKFPATTQPENETCNMKSCRTPS